MKGSDLFAGIGVSFLARRPIDPITLGKQHAFKRFPLSAAESKALDKQGYSAWMAYRKAKARAEGISPRRVWY